jgi:predicted alpha/beta-hydrolase family hydrolase
MTKPQAATITFDDTSVSGLLQTPHGARACYVVAHGAGARMTHPFMKANCRGLAER